MIRKSDFVRHLSQLNYRELYLLLKQKEQWSNIKTDDFFFRFIVAMRPIRALGIKELYHAPGVCKGEGCSNFCERGMIFYRLFAKRTNTILEDRLITPELESQFNECEIEDDYFVITVINLVLEGPSDELQDIAFCKQMDFTKLLQTDTEYFAMETLHPYIYNSEDPSATPSISYPYKEPTLMRRFSSRLKSLDSRILSKEFIERMNQERELYIEEYFFRDLEDRSINGFLKFHERAMVIQMIYRLEERRLEIMEAYSNIDANDDEARMEWLENNYAAVLKIISLMNGLDGGPDTHFFEPFDVLAKQDFWFFTNYSHFCFDMRPYRKVFELITLFQEEFDRFMVKYRVMTYTKYAEEFQKTLSWESPRLHYLYFLATDEIEGNLNE